MKLKLTATIVAALLGTSTFAFAEDNATTQPVQQASITGASDEAAEYNNAIAEKTPQAQPGDSRSAEDIVTDNIDTYLAAHPDKDGSKYTSGIAIMAFDPTDTNYGDSLQLKYIEAVANAQAAFVTSVNQEITDKVSSQSVSNQGTNAYTFDGSDKPLAGSAAASLAKTQALTDAQLDLALKAQGMDPDDFQSPQEKRKVLAQVEMTVETMTKAYGDLAGLITVKTFFEQKDGQGAVGVVLRYSPKIRTLFEAIKRGDTPAIVGKGQSPRELFVGKSGYDLFPEFGVRLGFDENSQPYILSYGQGTYTGPKVPGQSSASFAYQQADLMAKRNIAQAMAGTMSTSSSIKMAQQAAVTLVKNQSTGQETQKTTNEISKQLKTNMESQASASIKGLTQVKRWNYQVPGTTNKIYGVVYEWTPEFAQSASDVLNYDYDDAKKQYAPKTAIAPNEADAGDANARVSRQSQDNPYENQW